jgi:hypothetical protein
VNRKTDKAAAELHAAIHRIKKSPTVDARMQALRDAQGARERRERIAAVKAAAAEPIVTGVDIYKQDRRRAQDQLAEAVYTRASSPNADHLSAKTGPWFQHKKPATPDEPGLTKGAQIFKAAQAGDPEAQRIVREAVSSVADQVQRAIATHNATTGSGVNKAAGVDNTPQTTYRDINSGAEDIARQTSAAEEILHAFDRIGPAVSQMAPALRDFIASQQKVRLDPVTFAPLTRPVPQSTPTGPSEEADRRSPLPGMKGTLTLGDRNRP